MKFEFLRAIVARNTLEILPMTTMADDNIHMVESPRYHGSCEISRYCITFPRFFYEKYDRKDEWDSKLVN